MNFLAHLFLSGNSKDLAVGNFIGDFVKGRDYEKYPEKIKNGILLHRQIDTFTDKNQYFRKSSKRLQPQYRKYAGVVTDIFYDHFLSVEWKNYSDISLDLFIKNSYKTLIAHKDFLPQKIKEILFIMIKHKRLESYVDIEGIENVLNIMSNYTSLPNHSKFAIETLTNEYNLFKNDFNTFFLEMTSFVKHTLLKTATIPIYE